MSRLASLGAVLLAAAASPARGGDAVDVTATLHLRATATGNRPDGSVLYDPAAQTFSLDGYLVPGADERFASGFASFALDGRHLDGDLRWSVSIDSGEVRRRRFPETAQVCLSVVDDTGLATPGSGLCRFPTRFSLRPVIVPLDSTALGAPELTSNGRPIADERKDTVFLREAYAALSLGPAGFATVRAGKRRLSVADGFVYDDYATGAEVALDLGATGPPLSVSAAVFEPSRDLPRHAADVSPMLAVRADWLPSLFEHAGIFLALQRDRSGGMAELLRDAVIERLATEWLRATTAAAQRTYAQGLARFEAARAESDATLGWLGTSGSVAPWRGQRIRWTAALLRGRVDHIRAARLDPSQPPVTLAEDLELSGHLASLAWDVDLGRRVTAGASFLWLSGGELPRRTPGSTEPLTGTYRGFIGVAPFVTRTNLFFGGGLSESFATRRLTAPGVNGRGVIAPGLSLGWDPTDAVGVVLGGAWLRADAPGPFGGRVYGTEVDLEVTWQLARWVQLGAEADALFPGDFFPGDRTMTKVILALDLLTP